MKASLAEKIATTACAAAFALATLTGCANGGSATESETSEQEQESLTVVNLSGLLPDNFISAFNEAHPEVFLEVSAYSGSNGSGFAMTTLEHGEIPDIYISTQPFSPEAQREYLIDLSAYPFITNYATTMLNSVDNEGGIYLLPSCFQMTGISYNKTLMEQHDWKVPNSLEELLALAPKIEAAGYDVMRCMFDLDGYPFNYFFNILNTDYFHTSEGTQWKAEFPKGEAKAVGNEELLAGVEYFKRWIDAGLIEDASDKSLGPQEAFMNGECVFFLSLGLSSYEHTTEDGRTYEFDVIPWLSDDGTTNTLTTTISRYFGLNKELLEPGNEQKLADALTFMEYISTLEGQQTLAAQAAAPHLYTAPLAGAGIPEDSPFHELEYLVEEGHTVQLVYMGWEELIVPIAQDIRSFVAGEMTPEQLLEAFDATYAEVAAGDDGSVAWVEEDLSLDETARICAIATGYSAGADAALVSYAGYNDAREINDCGVAWHFYEGGIGTEEINMVRARCWTISVLEMTGAEIKALAESGADLYESGSTFPYLLVTKGDIELVDDEVYRLAVGTEELSEPIRAKEVERLDITSQQAMLEYLPTLGSFTANEIVWK